MQCSFQKAGSNTEPCANARGYKGEAVCVEMDGFCSYGERRTNQSADVRNMGQFAGDGKTGGPNDADQH